MIVGDGKEVHDYIHVTDIAAGCVAAMTSDTHGLVMNLATAVEFDADRGGADRAEGVRLDAEPEYRPDTRAVRSAGGTHLGFSRKRAETATGWAPRVPLEEGIRRYVRWLEQQRHA